MKYTKNEVIEIRDTDPGSQEQIDRLLQEKLRKHFGSWSDIAEPSDTLKIAAREHELVRSRKFRYPMRNEIKIEIKRPDQIDPSVVDVLSSYIKNQMAAHKQTEAVLTCETFDRVGRSRRKDKTRCAPKVEAKLIICSHDDVLRAVNELFHKINTLKDRMTIDGVKAQLRLGVVNTLEFMSDPGEEDVFHGF